MPHAVFVYGTLMPGRLRWPLLSTVAVDQRPATVGGWLWDTGNGWPAARFLAPSQVAPLPMPTRPSAPIPGWRVTWRSVDGSGILALLDEVEGSPYRRVVVPTTAGDAWSYECRTVDAAWTAITDWTDRPER